MGLGHNHFVKSKGSSQNFFFHFDLSPQKLFLFCLSIFFLFFTSSCSFKNKETLTEPSISTNTDDGSTPGGGGGGGGGGAIHGPLPAISSVTLSMISAATTSMVGPYTLYTGGVATPTIRVAGVNAGNRIRLYAWDANSGPYICTTVSAEQTATTANEDLIISPGLTNGYWIVIAVLDDGSGTNTGCPSVGDVTGQVVSFVYYNLTVVATPPTSMTLISPASNSSYNTRHSSSRWINQR